MAVLGIYEASVSSGGTTLTEFDDPDADVSRSGPQDASKITKYLQAQAGSFFTVSFQLGPGFRFGAQEHVLVDIYIDGQFATGSIISQDKYNRATPYTGLREGVRAGAGSHWVLRKFKFASLRTNEDSVQVRPEDLASKYGQLGEIRVEFWRRKGFRDSRRERCRRDTRLTIEEVPEKALKGRAIDLSVGLGEPETTVASQTWTGKKIGDAPLAAFVFKYRKTLKQLEIIESTPEPISLEDRPVDELTRDELRELVRRQKAAAEAAKRKIKQERAEASLRTLRTLKRECGTNDDNDGDGEVTVLGSSHKKRREAPKDVIDLSMED